MTLELELEPGAGANDSSKRHILSHEPGLRVPDQERFWSSQRKQASCHDCYAGEVGAGELV